MSSNLNETSGQAEQATHNHEPAAQEQEAATSQTIDSPSNDTAKKGLFSNGVFVLLLVAFALFIVMITWSVSFLSMFFGAIGALIMAAKSCLSDDRQLRFICQTGSCQITDENFVYLAIRAVVGMLTGTGLYLIAFQDVAAPWAAIATLSMFGGLIFDRLIFNRSKS